MPPAIKLSWPATKEFWEIPVLHEDAHILAVEKPARLLDLPVPYDPARPALMQLLWDGIGRGAPWARERGLDHLSNAHRMDFESSGVFLLAKSKPDLARLKAQFSAPGAVHSHVALVRGAPDADEFTVEEPLAPHPIFEGQMRVDRVRGTPCGTRFMVLERFKRWTLLKCEPLAGRVALQIRAHLGHVQMPVAGDTVYGGKQLLLSTFKPTYRLKPGREERPLISALALHAGSLSLAHPVTGADLRITSPWPRDLRVAVKYLRLYARESASGLPLGQEVDEPPADVD